MDFISKIISILKLPLKVVVPLFIFCVLLILMPENISKFLLISDLIKNYKSFINITILSSIVYFLSYFSFMFFDFIFSRTENRRVKKRFRNLSNQEKLILKEFKEPKIQNRRVILPKFAPEVLALEEDGIIYSHYGLPSSMIDPINEYFQLTELGSKYYKNKYINLPPLSLNDLLSKRN